MSSSGFAGPTIPGRTPKRCRPRSTTCGASVTTSWTRHHDGRTEEGGFMTEETLTARELGRRSRAAVHAKDRDGWLGLFADDAVVQDPIGPSPFDPDGNGHRGPAAIAAFYDNVIDRADSIAFEIERS